MKGSKAKYALKNLGPENLDGKTVIDTTNPIADVAPINGVLVYTSNINKSLMEELQKIAPSAKLAPYWINLAGKPKIWAKPKPHAQ